jgi:hypothetical protein
MKLRSRFLVSSFCFDGVAIGAFEGSPYRPHSSCDSETESDEGEPASRVKLLSEIPTSEETSENTQRELEPDRRITTDSFPAIVHQYCKNAALTYHAF